MLPLRCQSGPGSDGSEGVLRIPQSSSITRASPWDCLVSYTGHSFGGTVLAPLQRCNRCILQPQPTGPVVRNTLVSCIWTFGRNIGVLPALSQLKVARLNCGRKLKILPLKLIRRRCCVVAVVILVKNKVSCYCRNEQNYQRSHGNATQDDDNKNKDGG